jgi:acyl-coenzyme A thioesterase PaaI-like protein
VKGKAGVAADGWRTEVARFSQLPAELRFGIGQVAVTAGQCRAEQRIAKECVGAPIAWLGTLIDFTMGRAMQTVLPPDVAIRTASVHVDAAGCGAKWGDTVTAEAAVLDVDEDTGLVGARITAASGRVIVHATGRFAIVEGTIKDSPATAPPTTTPTTDLLSLLGGRPTSTGIEVAPQRWMANPYNLVHGGILIALAHLGIERAAATDAPLARVLDAKVVLHRPGMLSGGPMVAEAIVDRAGRRMIGASATLYQGDPRRPLATATASLHRS